MRNDKGRGSIESSGGHCESQCKSSVTLVQRWQVKINIKGLIEERKSPRDRVIIPVALPRSVPYLALKVCSPGKPPQSQADQGGWSPYLEGQNGDWKGMISCLQYWKNQCCGLMYVCVCIYLYFLKFLTYSGIWDLKGLLVFLYMFFSTCEIEGYKRGKSWKLYSFWMFLVILLII